jgi:hypothetical protein
MRRGAGQRIIIPSTSTRVGGRQQRLHDSCVLLDQARDVERATLGKAGQRARPDFASVNPFRVAVSKWGKRAMTIFVTAILMISSILAN